MVKSLEASELQAKGGKIPKVSLLRGFEISQSDDYDPKVVSLGPYHYGKPHLKLVEDFKPKALQMFIQGSEHDEEYFHGAILNKIEDARSCYVEEFSCILNENFARMMLLDACFILNDIEISTDWTKQASAKRHKTIKEHLGAAVYLITRRDLYLLENQVPFWILNLLVSLRYPDKKDGKEFLEVVERYCYEMFFEKQAEGQHLKRMREYYANAEPPSHILEILRRVIVSGSDQAVKNPEARYVFRSVTDLKSKGIDFKSSEINCLKTGVSFKSDVLKLPRWYVTIYTKVFFKNMIAYEFHPFSTKDKVVIAYVNFMKSLVNTSNDVKELREKKIIFNSLGSDEEVVQVYNSLHTYGADDHLIFQDVKWDIIQHCDSKWKTWFAEFKSVYFRSPWTAIALVAGILIFIFNIIQIYYAIKGNNKPNESGSKSRPGSRL